MSKSSGSHYDEIGGSTVENDTACQGYKAHFAHKWVSNVPDRCLWSETAALGSADMVLNMPVRNDLSTSCAL